MWGGGGEKLFQSLWLGLSRLVSLCPWAVILTSAFRFLFSFLSETERLEGARGGHYIPQGWLGCGKTPVGRNLVKQRPLRAGLC